MNWLIPVCICVLLVLIAQVECKERRNRDKNVRPLTYGAIQDAMDDPFLQWQVFMQHQIRGKHNKNKYWRGGRGRMNSDDVSNSNSDSSEEFVRRQKTRSRNNTNGNENEKRIFSPEERFKKFVKFHQCEDSEVYKKFLTYYKEAVLNNGQGNEDLWLTTLSASVKEDPTTVKTCSCSSSNSNLREPQSKNTSPQIPTPSLWNKKSENQGQPSPSSSTGPTSEASVLSASRPDKPNPEPATNDSKLQPPALSSGTPITPLSLREIALATTNTPPQAPDNWNPGFATYDSKSVSSSQTLSSPQTRLITLATSEASLTANNMNPELTINDLKPPETQPSTTMDPMREISLTTTTTSKPSSESISSNSESVTNGRKPVPKGRSMTSAIHQKRTSLVPATSESSAIANNLYPQSVTQDTVTPVHISTSKALSLTKNQNVSLVRTTTKNPLKMSPFLQLEN